jgi:uncharacterized protein involved in exopolysaccharide biosynthesis
VREALATLPAPDAGQPPGVAGQLAAFVAFPVSIPGRIYRWLHGVPEPTAFDQLAASVDKHLSISAVRKSNLIEITYDDGDVPPEWAARFVNALVDRQLERHAAFTRQSDAQRFFQSQERVLAERAADAEKALRTFHEREQLESMPEQRAMWSRRLATLREQVGDAEALLAEKQARVVALETELGRQPSTVQSEARQVQNQAVQYLKPKILEKELRRAELDTSLAPGSPSSSPLRRDLKEIENQLAAANKVLADESPAVREKVISRNPTHQALEVDLAQSRAASAALHARVTRLHEEAQTVRERVTHLESVGSEQASLERGVQTAQETLLTYTRKAEEARISSALDQSRIVNLAVALPAEVPPTPAGSGALVLMAAGLVASLLVAAAGALALEALRPTVQSVTEASELTGLAPLAELR